jgi:hypothetical protein
MWISWSGNILTLGRGSVAGIDPVIFFNDTSPIDIKYISMANLNGNGVYAFTWILPAAYYLTGLGSFGMFQPVTKWN